MKTQAEQPTSEDEDDSTQQADDTSSGEESSSDKASEPEGETEDKEPSSEDGEGIKVPEEFQKRAVELVQSCTTLPCLDFLMSEVTDQRHKIMSSQKKSGLETNSFSTERMPEL